MSKNILIKQNGIVNSFSNTHRIKTNNIDGGTTEWVPADERVTKVKKITLNGEYIAQERDSAWGYRAVFVNVPYISVTGRNPIDGKRYKVTKDSNGFLVWTLVDIEEE